MQSIYYPIKLIGDILANDARISQMEEKQLRLLRFDFAIAKDDIARLVDLVNTAIWHLM